MSLVVDILATVVLVYFAARSFVEAADTYRRGYELHWVSISIILALAPLGVLWAVWT